MQGGMQVSPATYCCVGCLQPEGQHALKGLCQGIQSLGSCHVDAGCQCNCVQRLNLFILYPTPHTNVAYACRGRGSCASSRTPLAPLLSRIHLTSFRALSPLFFFCQGHSAKQDVSHVLR